MEKPILFNTEMVKAILEGRKTCTRRITKFKPYAALDETNGDFEICEPVTRNFFRGKLDFERWAIAKCKYKAGDVLYVRETWANTWTPDGEEGFVYRADGEPSEFPYWGNSKQCKDKVWRPSIHMPKSAARIFLKVKGVRVEKLQGLDYQGALGEGIVGYDGWTSKFKELWDSTLKKEQLGLYSWNSNPWVWVIKFERIDSQK